MVKFIRSTIHNISIYLTKKCTFMTSDQIDSNVRSNEGIDLSSGLPNFIIKTAIVSTAIVLTLGALLPDIPRIPETERNKLIVLSFIQNPNILWKLSSLEVVRGKKENAISYLEAAIGLLEMHGASEKIIKRYQDQLDSLKK